jgi:uncharacterized heparinase superfamily protein
MLVKILLIFRTIVHLKFIQVYYQVWYRVKSYFIHWNKFEKYIDSSIHSVNTETAQILIVSNDKLKAPSSFLFLNLYKEFNNKIDWAFSDYGKLWNYNLQYFDFLMDDAVKDEYKIAIINDFCLSLKNKSISLEPYPVSLRLVNWIIYASKKNYTSPFFTKTLKNQIDYLEQNLEFHIQANHLLENYIALCFSGLAMKDNGMVQKYLFEIKKQLKGQVLNDGGHYECSPMYHNIILSKLLLIYDACIKNMSPIEDISWLKMYISKMFGWLNSFEFSNGTLANFNDATFDIATSIKNLKTAAEILQIDCNKNSILSDSGYRKLKQGELELLMDIGDIKPSFQPGHAHSDMLSFCLSFSDKNIIVDPGVSTYQPGKQRILERSTSAHNTVTINRENQSEVWGSFRVGKRAQINIVHDTTEEISASHNGYYHKYRIHHCRTVSKKGNGFLIFDNMIGSANNSNEIEARFYLNHNLSSIIKYEESKVVVDNKISFSFEGATNIQLLEYKLPLGYNVFENANCICVKFSKQLTTTISLS